MTLFETMDGGGAGGIGGVGGGDQPGRRHLSERQTELMERIVAAAADEAEERTYGEDRKSTRLNSSHV